MKKIIQYTIIILFSFAFSLFLFEIFLNLKNSKLNYNEIKKYINKQLVKIMMIGLKLKFIKSLQKKIKT